MMAKEISGLLKKNYVHLELEKKYTKALQDGLAGYIKIIHYYHFTLPTRTVPLLN